MSIKLRLAAGYPSAAFPTMMSTAVRRAEHRARTEFALPRNEAGGYLRFLLTCCSAAMVDDPPPGPCVTFSQVTLLQMLTQAHWRTLNHLRASCPQYIVINSLGKHIPGLRCVEYVIQPALKAISVRHSEILTEEMTALGICPEIFFSV